MPTVTAGSRALRLLLLFLLLAPAATGCATAKPTAAKGAPALTREAARSAVLSGVEALAAFRREAVEAEAGRRAPDYSAARGSLAGALAVLRPAGRPGLPEVEGAVLALECAQEGMAKIAEASGEEDEATEEAGWELFDQSVRELLLVLEPQAPAAAAPRRL